MGRRRYPSRQVRDLAKIVEPLGWTHHVTKRGNVRWFGPQGQVVTSGTHMSYSSYRNTLAHFRQAGVPRA